MRMVKKFSGSSRKDIVIDSQSPFAMVEAFRAVKTNLLYSIPQKKDGSARKLMVCSALPAEGKSTVAVNVAVSYAESNKRVLLIDCDLRKPRLHKFFNVAGNLGLSHYLSNQESLENIVSATPYEGLYVIYAGFNAPNPDELLSSERMQELMDEMSTRFDIIILDTPPMESVSDALLLVPYVDGVLLTVISMQSRYPILKNTIRKFEFAGCKVLGVVINGVRMEQKKYYKYDYYQSNGGYQREKKFFF